jgi:hypothetical protein
MKNSLMQGLILCLLPLCLSAQKSTSIFFETKQTVLSTEAKSQLTAFIVEIKRLDINKINIVGFADTDGSDKLNQDLSEQRAMVVKTFLIEQGVDNQLITAMGRGKMGAGSDKNRSRRVDIVVEFLPVNAPPIVVKPAVTTPTKPIPNIMALYQALSTPIQTFKIATNRDTLLRGAKGTAIFIPKNVFEGVPANTSVDFRLKEAYSMGDIVSDNLNTTSGDKILQTGGMIYTDALYNGKPVQLKDNILVSFASAESRQKGMQIYSGRRNSQQNGKMDWQLQPTESEETVAYRTSGSDNPFMMRTGEKNFARFAEWTDVSSCGVYFKNSDPKKYTRTTDLNATCTTILAYVDTKPALKNKTIEEVHKLIFSDMYSFYKVNTLPELQKQDGRRWDSLLVTREKVYDLTDAGDKRRDSLQKVQEKEREKMAILMAEQNRRNEERLRTERFFPVNTIGWSNCDQVRPEMLQTRIQSIVTTDIPSQSDNAYSIRLVFPKRQMVIQGFPNNGLITFGQLPQGLDGYMVGMKTDNNQPYLAVQKIKTDNIKVTLDFKAVTAAEIQKAFSELN